MIRRLSKCVREFKTPSVLSPIFITLEVVMEVIIPLLMAKLIDKGINGNGGTGDMGYVLRMGAVLLGCCALSMLFGAFSGHFAAIASSGFARNVRHDMYHNIQNFSFTSIDRFSTSSLVTRLTTDVTNLQNSYQMLIRIAFRSPATLVFSLLMAFSVNPSLSLVFLICIPVLGGGLFYIMTHAHPIFERVFKTYDKLNNVVQENLRGIRVVKTYVREEHEKEKFNTVSNSIYKDFSKAERLLAINAPLMQICMYGAMLLIAWFGAHMIVSGSMTDGQLMSMITYAMQILMSLMMLSMIFVMLVISRASAERIDEVLQEKTDLHNPASPLYSVPDGSIEFSHVDFGYSKEKLCLRDINLSIRSGETIGILGGTGSAKSSLVNLIPRLYDAAGGTVSVGGQDVRRYDIETLRNAVAVVLQKNVLFSGTIKENLRWGNPDATDDELIEACKMACADGFIREFPDGYDTHIEQGGTNVSGGQKQRLCIARALLKKPKIIILDDSTSAVDTKTDLQIRTAFTRAIPDTTKIIIAQRIASVEKADKIIVMEQGHIDGMGTHDELLKTNAIYQEVYNSQVKGVIADDARG